jgi:ATP-dependent DNA helicase RecG
MPEQQNTEYKSIWDDKFLKWICGFANAQGGRIFIGKEDDGTVVGLKNSKKLLEDLPNKITAILGIVCDVNLHEKSPYTKML